MSHEPEGVISVSDGEVTVEKTFAADEFPVPAIKFVIASTRDEPTRVRVIDRIPESFTMESVGFHPEYDSENWTAYKDHRVEYERTLDPGEEVVTVYGIRLTDGHQREDFLEEPTLERIPVDGGIHPEDIDDILGEDRSQLVRDVLAGNRDPVGDDGADDETEASAGVDDVPSDEDLAAAFENVDDEIEGDDTVVESAVDGTEDEVDTVDADTDEADESEGEETADEAAVALGAADEDDAVILDDDVDEDGDGDAGDQLDASVDDAEILGDDGEEEGTEELVAESTEDVEVESEHEPSGPRTLADDTSAAVTEYLDDPEELTSDDEADTVDTEGGLVAAIAAEIREGAVDDDDLAVVREAVETETRRSTDVRIQRLQSQMEDLAAYSDALASFIDEEGTGQQLVAEFREEMQDFRADIDALDSMVDEAVESADDTASRLDAAEETLAAVDERSERAQSKVERVDGRLDAHDGRLEDLSTGLEDHDNRLHDHHERLEDHDSRLDTASRNIDAGAARLDTVEETLEERAEELGSIHGNLDELAGRLDETVERIDGVESETEATSQTVSNLNEEIGEIREDIASLDGDIVETRDSLESRLEDVQSSIEDAAAEDEIMTLRKDIEDLNESVAELDTFRERLAGAFGTGMGGEPEDE
ncbi:hypothetical protein [Haloferax profundi]|uniref:Uncharacterized protein n=1 Tax=Haloferax profundi TaxID=1544718 RepID=A0A0W1SWJ5_9EURY|nr:hypothetical protein [Haloferax profundi]KTG30811.1 hypothetical protein AUR66_06105 [Haloferax profundi]